MLRVIEKQIIWRKVAAVTALALSLGLCFFAGHMQHSQIAVSSATDATGILCEHTLSSFGWKTSGLVSQDQVTLPETFGSSYADFLALQKEAGFHLAPYAGKTVTRYTYEIKNYPVGSDIVYADLMVYNHVIIGGDVRSSSLDGFMSSLVYPNA